MAEYLEKSVKVQKGNSKYIYSNISLSNAKYLFDLKLKNKPKHKSKIIRKIVSTDKCELIISEDEIKFSDLHKFKVNVKIITDYDISKFSLSGKIDQNKSSFSDSNSDVFIEFSQNEMGYVICNCILLEQEDKILSLLKIFQNKILEKEFNL